MLYQGAHVDKLFVSVNKYRYPYIFELHHFHDFIVGCHKDYNYNT